MSRILAVLLFLFLMSGSLFAAVCQNPPDPNCLTPTPGGSCTVPVTWFRDNQGCMGGHSEIKIGHLGHLIVTAGDGSVGNFKVMKFKKYDPCAWTGSHTLATPFDVNPGGSTAAHTLTAHAGSNGCYTVNFVAGHATIDPHIIITGN